MKNAHVYSKAYPANRYSLCQQYRLRFLNLHGEAGSELTNLSASFGAEHPGMTVSGNWPTAIMMVIRQG